jgi:hypothetical protein
MTEIGRRPKNYHPAKKVKEEPKCPPHDMQPDPSSKSVTFKGKKKITYITYRCTRKGCNEKKIYETTENAKNAR